MAEFWGFAPCEGNAFFTSYNSLDWQRAAPIAKALMSLKYPVWYDYGLEAGTRTWREQISIHIDSAHAVILFITNGIFDRKSSYVINEYEESKEIGKVVIPVFLDTIELIKIEPKYRSYVTEWKRLQCVMCSGESPSSTARKIAEIIDESKEIRFSVNTAPQIRTQQKSAVQPGTQSPAAEAYLSNGASVNSKITVGSCVTFGSYPQSSNNPEPIVWRVLDIIDGKALMISESLLDCRKYNEWCEEITWKYCSLRKWLNGDFMRKAFSAGEQKKLIRVKNNNADSHGNEAAGEATDDYVFCLSFDEARRYFTNDDNRKAKPTAYARKNGCYVNATYGTGWWWLRSLGGDGGTAADIDTYGRIYRFGNNVNLDDGCVRPVISIEV